MYPTPGLHPFLFMYPTPGQHPVIVTWVFGLISVYNPYCLTKTLAFQLNKKLNILQKEMINGFIKDRTQGIDNY